MSIQYRHCICSCGGVIGEYRLGDLRCDKCGKEYTYYELDYDTIQSNPMTGWLFPMKYKETEKGI